MDTQRRYYIMKKCQSVTETEPTYLSDIGEQYENCCFYSKFPEMSFTDPDEAEKIFCEIAQYELNIILISKEEPILNLDRMDSSKGLRSFEEIGYLTKSTKQNTSQICKATMKKILSNLKRNNQEYSHYDIVFEMMKYFKCKSEEEIIDFYKSFPMDVRETIKKSYAN